MITWSTYDEKIADYLIKNDNHIIGISNDDGRIKFEFEVLGKLCADINDYYGDSGPDSFREWIKKITVAYNECLAPQEEGGVSNENIQRQYEVDSVRSEAPAVLGLGLGNHQKREG